MRKFFIVTAFVTLLFASCKKDISIENNQQPEGRAELTGRQKEVVERFEHASYVLSAVLANKQMRTEFNQFILAKVKKTGTDEELTFREIFSGKQVNLPGVRPDFLNRFREAFVNTFISGKYRHAERYTNLKFQSATDVEKYFGIVRKQTSSSSSVGRTTTYDETIEVPDGYEIYYPYSENFEGVTYNYYAVSYNPVTTMEENTGELFDAYTGTYVDIVPVDDDYAYGTPTYIVTYDDGLNMVDFANGSPIGATNYKIILTDDDYNPSIIQSTLDDPNPSPCTKELRVKDGRWTLLSNGYGIFEGKIEFACAVSRNVTEVNIPQQNTQSNPIIKLDKTAHAWAYIKMKRSKVRDMRDNEQKYVSFGMHVSPWCAEQPDKMIFLYEYDKPWLLSSNAKEFSDFISGAIGLIGDSATRATLSSLASAGLAPVVKAILEGTAQSQIEHYSIIGSNAVTANQGVPTNGISPSLLNGYRLYGKSSVAVSLVVD